ncbi:ATPase [Terriglobus saanensis]|uniref:ATP synthase subunit b n=1 Tax=Terriglobus saanensis (strain ATCC BAA-1853 / DSM 23119 / SP1PR4) TaxID=401053 RepID=E8V840_TERSS|nr:ATPase [Terriglobus saanensis]ADV84022.1 H+transporting two-sector ATPase B/B' subunit [Terriglobus saanensis SP1PR4]
MTMRACVLLALVLMLGVAPVVPLRAQAVAASPSTASGQKAEPQANSAGKKKEAEEGTEAFKKSPMVISLGRMMGMSPETASTVFTWFNFVILALAILYALAKALPKTFRGRTQGIQKNLVEARSATEEANARLSGVEARLAKLDGEIAALKSEAEKDAAADEARIKASVADERERIAHAAEQEIAAAEAHAQRNLREFAAKLAVEQAASKLNISDDDDSEIVRGFAARLAASGKGGSN